MISVSFCSLGGLYGSEYWTFSLPSRVGQEVAEQLTEQLLPISAKKASQLGFIDIVLDKNHKIFVAQVKQLANVLIADSKELQKRLFNKAAYRIQEENEKPLAAYRKDELTQMYANFYGSDKYHEARKQFIYKVSKEGTPANIAKHRLAAVRINNFFRRQTPDKKTVFADKKNSLVDHSIGA